MNGGGLYKESIRQLEDLYHGPIMPAAQAGLRRIRYLLHRLGDPQTRFRSVHVAGSSGKGSTTSMIGSILQAAGFRTGYFRSPHLYEYTERVSVDGLDIDRGDWVDHFDQVWPVVEDMRSGTSPDYDLGRPSFFEVLFALMAQHFAGSGVEWAAVEAGMGGRLDATNSLDSDVAVVTNISLEHTHVLGKTIAAIAAEKAAIIKPGSYAVTAAQDPEALTVIEARAREVGAPLLRVGTEIRAQITREDLEGQDLHICGVSSLDIHLPLPGVFQAWNAATAIAAAVALRERGVTFPDNAIRTGLSSVSAPCRLDIVSKEPLVIFDGAHHPAAIDELITSLERIIPNQRVVALFAAMADKDVRRMALRLASIAEAVVLTRAPGTERARPPAELANDFADVDIEVMVEDDVVRAWERARALAGPDDALLVTGSMYLVGFLRHILARAPVTP